MFGSTLPGGSTGVSLPAAPEYQAADATNMVREPADCQIYLGGLSRFAKARRNLRAQLSGTIRLLMTRRGRKTSSSTIGRTLGPSCLAWAKHASGTSNDRQSARRRASARGFVQSCLRGA